MGSWEGCVGGVENSKPFPPFIDGSACWRARFRCGVPFEQFLLEAEEFGGVLFELTAETAFLQGEIAQVLLIGTEDVGFEHGGAIEEVAITVRCPRRASSIDSAR
jgi:hypothetical protein